MPRADLIPYGRVKESGMGREGCRHVIDGMTELKLICESYGATPAFGGVALDPEGF